MIKKGDKFVCLNTVYMNGDKTKFPAYIKNEIYKSEHDRCITDEKGHKEHSWTDDFLDTENIICFKNIEDEKKEILDQVNSNNAMRFNRGKPNFSLLHLGAMEPTVRVLEFGAMKYSRDNWMKGFPFSTIVDSMMRHIEGLQNGEWLDEESGLPHIGHLGCNAMFMCNKNNVMDMPALEIEYKKWLDSLNVEE